MRERSFPITKEKELRAAFENHLLLSATFIEYSNPACGKPLLQTPVNVNKRWSAPHELIRLIIECGSGNWIEQVLAFLMKSLACEYAVAIESQGNTREERTD
jgi:hypothetical protein